MNRPRPSISTSRRALREVAITLGLACVFFVFAAFVSDKPSLPHLLVALALFLVSQSLWSAAVRKQRSDWRVPFTIEEALEKADISEPTPEEVERALSVWRAVQALPLIAVPFAASGIMWKVPTLFALAAAIIVARTIALGWSGWNIQTTEQFAQKWAMFQREWR